MLTRSSYSKVDLDFVLATNSYSGDNGVQMATSSQFLQCFPCDAPSSTNSKKKARTKPSTADESHKKATVSSISLKLAGAFDLRMLKNMLDELLYANGATNTDSSTSKTKIYRIKGILHVHTNQKLFILQAVHNLFDLQESDYEVNSAEDKTNGENLLIVIGANLDQEEITRRFENCIYVSHS